MIGVAPGRQQFAEIGGRAVRPRGGENGLRIFHNQPDFACFTEEIEERRTEAGVLATGGGVVTDREAYRLLQKRCVTVWLRAAPEDHWQRVLQQGDTRPGDASADARSELRALLQAREPLYALASVTVDTSRVGLEGAIKEVARRVSRALATSPGPE